MLRILLLVKNLEIGALDRSSHNPKAPILSWVAYGKAKLYLLVEDGRQRKVLSMLSARVFDLLCPSLTLPLYLQAIAVLVD